jgi:hypothetical protein
VKKKANAGRNNGTKNGTIGLNTNPRGSQPNEGEAPNPTTVKKKANTSTKSPIGLTKPF